MVSIDVTAQVQQYTPRNTTIVDAVADTKRVLDAQIRANPLRNAFINDGLMRWKGNYSGGVNASYLWIGEFTPVDAVLNKPQRGFILSRDDPKRAAALWMYDPNAGSANPSTQPVRQLLIMHDADDNTIMQEGIGGGTAFPYGIIPMNPVSFTFYQVQVPPASPATSKYLPIIPASHSNFSTTASELYRGFGPMVGHKLKLYLICASSVSAPVGPSFLVYAVLTWNDGTTFTTTTVTTASGATTTPFWDLDFTGQNKVGKEVEVQVYAKLVSGGGEWNWTFVQACYSYGG